MKLTVYSWDEPIAFIIVAKEGFLLYLRPFEHSRQGYVILMYCNSSGWKYEEIDQKEKISQV